MKHTPRRILSLLRIPSFLVAGFLAACFPSACVLESPGEPQPKTPQHQEDTDNPAHKGDTVHPASERDAFLGPWLEIMPGNVVYFAGYRLELDFGRDSLDLRFHHWTDAIVCSVQNGVTECEKNHWVDVYRGSWTLQDSILRIECRQTLAGKAPGVDTTLRQVTYRITSGPGETLGLTRRDGANDFLTSRMDIVLQRAHALTF